MTWTERKVVSILCVILAVLFAALLIVLGIRYRENRDVEEPVATAPVVSEEIEETGIAYLMLSYYNGSTTLNFARDENGAWIWCVQPDTMQPDPAIINHEINKGFGGLNDVLALTSEIEGVLSFDQQPSEKDPGCVNLTIGHTPEADIRRAVFQAISDLGCIILSMQEVRHTLEDIFLELTNPDTPAAEEAEAPAEGEENA